MLILISVASRAATLVADCDLEALDGTRQGLFHRWGGPARAPPITATGADPTRSIMLFLLFYSALALRESGITLAPARPEDRSAGPLWLWSGESSAPARVAKATDATGARSNVVQPRSICRSRHSDSHAVTH